MMAQLLTSGCAALIYKNVFTEAYKFKKLYDELRNKIGDEFFPFIGFVRPDMLDGLYHRNYPWLYTTSILWAKHHGHVGENYTMTNYPVDLKMLKKGVKRTISSVSTITEQEMALLGFSKEQVADVLKSIHQKRKRAHSESSSSEE